MPQAATTATDSQFAQIVSLRSTMSRISRMK